MSDVAQVKKKFPDTETKLLIGCSDGRTYSMDALMALDEEGYTNIVGLKVRACVDFINPNFTELLSPDGNTSSGSRCPM